MAEITETFFNLREQKENTEKQTIYPDQSKSWSEC
jgi:hypothetical protein